MTDSNIYFGRKQISQKRKLNTQKCCFICLKITDFKSEEEGKQFRTKQDPVTLKYLCRYLKLDFNNENSQSKFCLNKEDNIEVDLCDGCTTTITEFRSSFAMLEAIQLKVNYWVDKIQKDITESSKNPELVQNYSKRMTSDPESLTQLLCVDKLRKEIVRKTISIVQNFPGPMIDLLPLENVEQYFPKPALNAEQSDSVAIDSEEDNQNDVSFPDLEDSEDIDEEKDKIPNVNPHLSSSPMPVSPSSALTDRIKNAKLLTKNAYTENSETGTFDCLLCKKPYKTSYAALAHYEAVHLPKKYRCDFCTKVFGYAASLHLHKKSCGDMLKRQLESRRTKERDPSYKFNCPTCNQKFRSRLDISRHLKHVHLRERNHSCDVCDKRFKTSDHMQKHKDSVHFGKKFQCKTCNKQFKWKVTAQRHEKKCTKVTIKSEIKIQQQQEILIGDSL